MVMQVHDELVFEVEDMAVEALSGEVKKLMESAVVLDVKLEVDVGIGLNWGEAH